MTFNKFIGLCSCFVVISVASSWLLVSCQKQGATRSQPQPNRPLERIAEGPLSAAMMDSAQCLMYQALGEPCLAELTLQAGDTMLRVHYLWAFESSVVYSAYKYAAYDSYVVVRKAYQGPRGEAGIAPGARRPTIQYQTKRQEYPSTYGLPTALLGALTSGPELLRPDIDGGMLLYELKTDKSYFRRRLYLNDAANRNLWARFQEYYALGGSNMRE